MNHGRSTLEFLMEIDRKDT